MPFASRLDALRAAILGSTASESMDAMKAAVYGPSSYLNDDRGWLLRMIGGKTKAGPEVNEFTAPYLPVVYACWNRIANPIARFPISIRRPKKGGGSREVRNHPMSRSLALRPNPFMGSRTLRKTVQAHALGWGNGYIEIERNGRGQAVALWPLLPDKTKPKKDVGSDAPYFETVIGGQTFKLPHDNVLHIMDLSHDGYVGLSPVRLAQQAIGTGLAMEEFGAKFFANEAKSGGFLLHPGKLSGGAKENIGKAKDKRSDPGADVERQGGLDNAHRIKVLEEGMKFIPTTIPPEDAQFLGTREFNIAEIARIYDVPLILLQSHEKSTSWGTGVEQLMIGFVRQTIEPWVAAWEQELNWKLFNEEERAKGYFVKFNMNALLRGDMQARAMFYKELFSLAGLTPNNILALEDMDPIGPEGDQRFVSNNVQPLSRALNPPDPATAPTVQNAPADAGDDEEDE
ncbi:phage portal protein [Hyphomonas sp.]|uniref:phage portal protein n=1 Tax=Hyphomonas sp. TaxID=87 RepID=UPI0025BBD735|nr:phage portal protein [Hyphomonas sp.]